MKDKFFIDTNVFIYSFDTSSPNKQRKAQEIINDALSTQSGCISYQVIQEFLNVATRKFATPLSVKDSQIYLATVLEPLCEVFSNIELYFQSLEISSRWQYSFYDSLIITAAIKS